MTVCNTQQKEVPLPYILGFPSFVNKKYSQTQAWLKITLFPHLDLLYFFFISHTLEFILRIRVRNL